MIYIWNYYNITIKIETARKRADRIQAIEKYMNQTKKR